MKTLLAAFVIFTACHAQAQTAAQLAAVQKTAVRRHVTIVAVEARGAACVLLGIGSVRDPAVIAQKKAGLHLKRYQGEYLYSLGLTGDPFASGKETCVILGLANAKPNTEAVMVLYEVSAANGFDKQAEYATSAADAVKYRLAKP